MDQMWISRTFWFALIAIVLSHALVSYVRGAWARYQAGRRVRVASKGERRAESLLVRSGYRIAERQATRVFVIHVDGEPTPVTLRADLIVTKGRRAYVAEVKTGQSAPSVYAAETRRQLLEYRIAYPCDGVLLVDMERGRIHEVVFPVDDVLEGAA